MNIRFGLVRFWIKGIQISEGPLYFCGAGDELEEEEDARMERKFPHLTSRGSNASEGPRYDVDEPPPLPPRPLETLRPPDDLVSEEEDSDEISEASPSPSPSSTSSPPPLPPTSAPPGGCNSSSWVEILCKFLSWKCELLSWILCI